MSPPTTNEVNVLRCMDMDKDIDMDKVNPDLFFIVQYMTSRPRMDPDSSRSEEL